VGIKTMSCHSLECDLCGHEFDYDYVPHFNTVEDAIEHVRDSDGWTDGKTVICENCTDKPHDYVPPTGGIGDCARCGIDLNDHAEDADSALAGAEVAP
jgi:hypothetical protein